MKILLCEDRAHRFTVEPTADGERVQLEELTAGEWRKIGPAEIWKAGDFEAYFNQA